MKKTVQTTLMLITVLLLASCNSKRSEYDPYKYEMKGGKKKQEVSNNVFEIDFKQTDSNLKTIHVNLNGKNSYDAIFDTGCSGILISPMEALDMMKQGTLRDSDERPPIPVQMADGSIVQKRVFNLREVTIMDKNGKPHTLKDIAAILEPNMEAAILVGSSVIDNLAKKSYTVDLRKKVIRFE